MPNYHTEISRTVVTTKCSGQHLVNGEFFDFYAEFPGCLTLKRAQSRLRREFADDTIVINNCEYEEAYYTMPMQTFIDHATKKERKDHVQ